MSALGGQRIERKECHHEILIFGSGDYYIFCDICDARWATTRVMQDKLAPEESNQGAGARLSGVRRIAP